MYPFVQLNALNRLKGLREDRELKQRDIEKIFNEDATTIARYENGNIPLSVDKLCILADYYNVSTDYIMYLTDEELTKDKIDINTNKTIKTRIKQLRRFHNLNQEYLANMIGIKQSAFSFYEQGLRNFLTDDIIVFCKYFKVSLDFMLFRTNNPEPYSDSKIRKYIEEIQYNK